MIQLNIDMPRMCHECPCFEKKTHGDNEYYTCWQGVPMNGFCKASPILDRAGHIVDYQCVSTMTEINNATRSPYCPFVEVKKANNKLHLQVGKTYLTETGRECKIVYKSPIRGTGYLGILATNFETHPDDAVWYNPDGTHNEKCDGINLVKEKL